MGVDFLICTAIAGWAGDFIKDGRWTTIKLQMLFSGSIEVERSEIPIYRDEVYKSYLTKVPENEPTDQG